MFIITELHNFIKPQYFLHFYSLTICRPKLIHKIPTKKCRLHRLALLNNYCDIIINTESVLDYLADKSWEIDYFYSIVLIKLSGLLIKISLIIKYLNI